MKKAFLILEDGTVFEGKSIGVDKEIISEIVFNTSMTGYLEVLTDPSYAGQAVTMTYPLIGNYGICYKDMESKKGWPDGFIVRELARVPSNFRSEDTVQHFLEKNDIPGISGIDTRALTKILREKGTMNGMITTNENYNLDEIVPKLKEYTVTGVVKKVSCDKIEKYVPGDIGSESVAADKDVAVIDVGTKKNIIRCLLNRGCNVTVYPCDFDADEVIASKPDGIMITNGPGDPAECVDIIAQVKKLADSNIPVFAICLGHQLMALAHNAKTYKMKYGHRGANQPVVDKTLDRTFVTSQNHGYAVIGDSIDPNIAEVSHFNANDGTCEGMRYKNINAFTVQFHPEAHGGPQDTEYLFDEFIEIIKKEMR